MENLQNIPNRNHPVNNNNHVLGVDPENTNAAQLATQLNRDEHTAVSLRR